MFYSYCYKEYIILHFNIKNTVRLPSTDYKLLFDILQSIRNMYVRAKIGDIVKYIFICMARFCKDNL